LCTVRAEVAIVVSAQGGFNTEANHDAVTIGGSQYSGTNGPVSVTMSAGQTMHWQSDSSVVSSGFNICAVSATPVVESVSILDDVDMGAERWRSGLDWHHHSPDSYTPHVQTPPSPHPLAVVPPPVDHGTSDSQSDAPDRRLQLIFQPVIENGGYFLSQ
jgi:hypothetical protein